MSLIIIRMENQIDLSTNKKPVALVTGANQGVGFQIAKALAANGYSVYVGSRNLGNGEKAAAEIGTSSFSACIPMTTAVPPGRTPFNA